MTDRNILPGSFRPGHYDLVLNDLEFSNWTYNGVVTYGTYPSSAKRELSGSRLGSAEVGREDAGWLTCSKHYW